MVAKRVYIILCPKRPYLLLNSLFPCVIQWRWNLSLSNNKWFNMPKIFIVQAYVIYL